MKCACTTVCARSAHHLIQYAFLVTVAIMILLAVLTADHAYGEAVKELDPDAIGVERYCSRIRLFHGAPNAEKLVRIEDPSEEDCKVVVSRYRARLQNLAWVERAIRIDLRTSGNTPLKKALRKQLLHLSDQQLLIAGRLCRELFGDAQGHFVCGYSSNRTYDGLAGRIVRFGDGPTLGTGVGDPELCAPWPLRNPTRGPVFDTLFRPPVTPPTSWTDVEAELVDYGFECDPKDARCSFKSGFVSLRNDDLMGISGTTVVLRLVARIESKSLSKRNLPSAGPGVRLCIGSFSLAL